jgi:hypothetical protein
VQSEGFARTQPAVEHQPGQRSVALATQRAQQGRDLSVTQRPRQPLDGLDPDAASHRPLPAGTLHERPMPFGNPALTGVGSLLNRVLLAQLAR